MSKHSLVIDAMSAIKNIKNSSVVGGVVVKKSIEVKGSSLVLRVMDFLKKYKCIMGYEEIDIGSNKRSIRIFINFDKSGKNVVRDVVYHTTNSRSQSMTVTGIKSILSDFSLVAVSTSEGLIMSAKECIESKIGGEVMFSINF